MTKQKSKKLKVLTKSFPALKIIHWVKDFGVRCHIFTIQIDSETHLKKHWESITNRIAIDFQADFKNEYESWNLYEVFLSESEISRDLKYKIENDKYSSRKIVMDKIPPTIKDDKIVDRVLKRIFQFDIFVDEPHDDIERDLSKIINDKLYLHISNENLEGQTETAILNRKKVFNKIYGEYSNEI